MFKNWLKEKYDIDKDFRLDFKNFDSEDVNFNKLN